MLAFGCDCGKPQLYENQHRLGDELYDELAARLKLDAGDLRKALASKAFADRVRADLLGGVRNGVNGTPTFYINSQRYDDPIDFPSLEAAIEKTLAS